MKAYDSLNNWSGVILEARTDEDLKDIKLLIKYNDHGDDFLYVKTYSGEQYKYGYWFDRKNCFEDFDANRNNGESDSTFIKRPILYKKPDNRSVFSNEVFWLFRNDTYGIQKHMDFGPQKYSDAGHRIDMILFDLMRIIRKYDDVMYHFESYRDKLLIFIALNELGQEYIDKVNGIKWSSSIAGFDGIAGKREADNEIYYDHIDSIWLEGAEYPLSNIEDESISTDRWGFDTYCLDTDKVEWAD